MENNYPMRVYTEENDGSSDWIVEYPDLPGCIGVGDSREKALAEAEINKALWLTSAEKNGANIPLPSQAYAGEYSGIFNFRIPRSLHRELAIKAELDGVSLNILCANLLSRGLTSEYKPIPVLKIKSETINRQADILSKSQGDLNIYDLSVC